MKLGTKAAAEAFGTFWLVVGGCGTAVLAGHNVHWVGVSLAFGLTVVTMAYAIGHISGCHLNPAVSVGCWVAKRLPTKDLAVYVVSQVVGGILGAGLVLFLAKARAVGYDASTGGLAANGYGDHSPSQTSLVACLVTEVVMTFVFLMVILGTTTKKAPAGFAGLAIGLCLVLIHLISIPVTNTSVNPARSTGPALFVGGWALEQLWLFWVAPLVGAVLGGLVHLALERAEDGTEKTPA